MAGLTGANERRQVLFFTGTSPFAMKWPVSCSSMTPTGFFSLYRPTNPSSSTHPSWLLSTLAGQRVETGRAVNYQEGILIKFFIVAARLQPEGPDADGRLI